MRAGCARVEITPPLGLCFGGKTHGEPIIISDIYSDIYARAVVFSSAEQKVAIAGLELCYFHAFWVNQVSRQVARETDIPAEHVFIIATHNHSGPDTFWNFDPDYLETVVNRIVACICEANSTLVEVRVGTATAPIPGPATNRRIKMKDGSVWMRAIGFDAPPAEQVVGPGPVDPHLRMVKVETTTGRPLAVIANYACHASVALESTCVSGDFPGYAAEVIEREMETLFLFTAGPSANINPIGFVSDRSDGEARRIGRRFADDVLELAGKLTTRAGDSVEVRKRTLVFPIRREFLESNEQPAMRFSMGSASRFFPSSLAQEVEKIRRMEASGILPPVLETRELSAEMSLIQIGDIRILTVPGELFVEIGLELVNGAPSLFSTITHCNDAIGYIPTAIAFEEGGYESAPFALSLLTPEAEAIVKTAAVALLDS